MPALLAVADEAAVPMCVELDHVSDDALIDAALAAGIGAVMADGSRLPLEENVAFAAGVDVDRRTRESKSSLAASREARMSPRRPRQAP